MTPTVFYWLNNLTTTFLDLRKARKVDLKNFKTIILVRYIPFKEVINLFLLFKKHTKIILILDDNLLDSNLNSELPFRYRLKIFFNIYCYKFFLKYFIHEIWVTNRKLGEKVKNKILSNNVKIKILKLSYPLSIKTKSIYKISYLGTSSHSLERRWLKILFEKIQSTRNDCLLEIYTDKRWRKFFKSIPRIKMIYPMDWETFHMDTSTRKIDIVLNPIIKSNFNDYRSPTKFFDTTRLGAVGIYSNTAPFDAFIRNNQDGILLENNIDLWNDKISYLLSNVNERERLFLNAQKRINEEFS